MKRRDFIAAALVVAYEMATQPGIAQTSKRARLGYLSGGPPTVSKEGTLGAAFKAALGELGWRVPETLVIEERFANGDLLTLPRLASCATAKRYRFNGWAGDQVTSSPHSRHTDRLLAGRRRSCLSWISR
jgi:hypothetical protein